MHVLLHSDQILSEDIHFIGLKTLFQTVLLTDVHYLLQVFIIVQVIYVSRTKYTVQIFSHLFELYLGIYKKK
jgi:hypothetical protein